MYVFALGCCMYMKMQSYATDRCYTYVYADISLRAFLYVEYVFFINLRRLLWIVICPTDKNRWCGLKFEKCISRSKFLPIEIRNSLIMESLLCFIFVEMFLYVTQ